MEDSPKNLFKESILNVCSLLFIFYNLRGILDRSTVYTHTRDPQSQELVSIPRKANVFNTIHAREDILFFAASRQFLAADQ